LKVEVIKKQNSIDHLPSTFHLTIGTHYETAGN
jgi:hypothetical protein